METLAQAAAILLALIFLVAAFSKLLAQQATASDFAAIGLPAASILAKVVPLAEIAVAVGLVLKPKLGALAALAALSAFSALLIWIIESGRNLKCGCFGTRNASPVTWLSLIRNILLMASAFVVISAG